jgi:hypothetical protein
MSKTQIPTGGIADDAVSEEHIDATVITASTALAAEPADTDEFLISDAGTIKRIDYSLIKGEVNQPIFKASLGSNQNISGGGNTTVAFDTQDYIVGSGVTFGSNKFTFSVAGKYYINYNFRVSSSEADGHYIAPKIIHSQDGEIAMREHRQGASGPVSVGGSTVVDISANDEISLQVYGDNAFTIAGGNIHLTYLLGFRVG